MLRRDLRSRTRLVAHRTRAARPSSPRSGSGPRPRHWPDRRRRRTRPPAEPRCPRARGRGCSRIVALLAQEALDLSRQLIPARQVRPPRPIRRALVGLGVEAFLEGGDVVADVVVPGRDLVDLLSPRLGGALELPEVEVNAGEATEAFEEREGRRRVPRGRAVARNRR